MNVHEAGLLEPLLQLRSGMDFVTGPFEAVTNFVVEPLECGTVEPAVFRGWIAVEILEFNPVAGLD